MRCLRGVADWPLGEADTAMPFTSFASGADDPSVVGAAEGGKSLHSEWPWIARAAYAAGSAVNVADVVEETVGSVGSADPNNRAPTSSIANL